MKPAAAAALLALGLGWSAGANAQAATVYRCGNAYSQSPCPAATALAFTDARTAAQRSQAASVAAREKRLGDGLQRDRLAAESRPGARAMSLDGMKTAETERPRAKKLKGWPVPKKKKAKAADGTG